VVLITADVFSDNKEAAETTGLPTVYQAMQALARLGSARVAFQ
jgi:Fe2+ or Zn2+ uptake regulation protein